MTTQNIFQTTKALYLVFFVSPVSSLNAKLTKPTSYLKEQYD